MGASELKPGGPSKVVVRFVGTAEAAAGRSAPPERVPGRALGRAEARQVAGNRLIVLGFAISFAGIVVYCAACLAGGLDVGLGEILFRNAIPLARGMLAVIGLGTVAWIAGSFLYLAGAMEADDQEPEPASSEVRPER